MANRLTSLSAAELEVFFSLIVRLFSDYRSPARGQFGLVYPFTETVDNEASNLCKVAELGNAAAASFVGICDATSNIGYAGFEHCVEQLRIYGFENGRVAVRRIKVTGDLNTLTEAEELLRQCDDIPGDIGIVAPGFHLVRSFMTMVSAMRRQKKLRRVYAIPGEPLDWRQLVRHSQGTLKNTRSGLIGDELVRLEKYRAPEFGSLLDAEQVLEYLDWRDSH